MIYRTNTQQCWERQQFHFAIKEVEKRKTTNRQNKPSQQSTQHFDINAFMAMLSQPHNQGSLQRALCPLGLGAGESHGICTQPDGVRACVLLRVPNPALSREGGQTRSGPSCTWYKDWGAGEYGWGTGAWEENGGVLEAQGLAGQICPFQTLFPTLSPLRSATHP